MNRILLSLLTITTLTHSIRLNILNDYCSTMLCYDNPKDDVWKWDPADSIMKTSTSELKANWKNPKYQEIFLGKISYIRKVTQGYHLKYTSWVGCLLRDIGTLNVICCEPNIIIIDIKPNTSFVLGLHQGESIEHEYPHEFTFEAEEDSDKEYFICAQDFFDDKNRIYNTEGKFIIELDEKNRIIQGKTMHLKRLALRIQNLLKGLK
jgi:hypothetical protein